MCQAAFAMGLEGFSFVVFRLVYTIPHQLAVGVATVFGLVTAGICATRSIIPRMLTHSHTHNPTGDN